ncbi:M48 family metallopeptidase [Pontibacter flavimaris]|uniref:Metal-dependent hydrolase n=1 Tax=Pontibacter flavimaris TaxID=1797110 RepID=A0A1Q5PCQ3_9BACT|nr:SprT family zinc-dependent metalloprotease [Pontibacter flavimaris]OKL39977.1 metal-dependent hydrolase [Pontibacter flavimaris]
MKSSKHLIQYNLKRSQRKTVSIYVERDGEVMVMAPKEMSDAAIDELVDSKAASIFKHQAELEELNQVKKTREPVNGESYLYLGRNYRLELVEKQEAPLKLKDGYFLLQKKHAPKAEQIFKQYYKEKGAKRIPERVRYYEKLMGLTTSEIKIMDLQNRWASCNTKGDLNFHWKCMMAPLKVLDYIIVHELAHLIHANHSEAFWNEVDKVLPDYRERKNWLRVNGAGMDL